MSDSLFDLLSSLEDMEHLIASGHRESETVEYKTASRPMDQREHTELAKDLSAFANSAGGVVIYGVATDRDDKTRPVRLEPIDPTIVDVVMQIAATHVRHPIPGIRWKTLPRGDQPQVLIADIPPSALAPHQVAVRDYRYYRRHGPISEPMTHDLLELYFGRRLGPVLTPRIVIDSYGSPVDGEPAAVEVRLFFRARNIGQRIARDVMFLGTTISGPEVNVTGEAPNENSFNNISGSTRSFGAYHATTVLHPGIERTLFICTMQVSGPFATGELPLMFFGYYADEMAAVKGRVFLNRSAQGVYSIRLTDEAGEPWPVFRSDAASTEVVA